LTDDCCGTGDGGSVDRISDKGGVSRLRSGEQTLSAKRAPVTT
jgi:hypothetical protein